MTERPNLSRRRLLQAAALVPAAAVPAIAVGSPANAAYLGNIVRADVIERAQNWYNRNIQYNGASRASDIEGGHTYRQDCSGFVSMAWHSATPGHSTRTLPDLCTRINWGQLKPGDIVNSYDNHCMLFHKWSTTSGKIWIYDLATPELDMRHVQVTTANLRAQNYIPWRYDRIRDN
ncbi:twin-arginine translocation signal domain-containing protein [Glycomyces mayteni]|uniref:Twin-arginine translocation signal domain-containing protein n=1 Tax=Glycomyces mayteni TaxID=543887 RepID=A0ABW2D9M0_9ACTN|nr:hypothetical protein GCM10025732_33360 [Glycomyces mayteni]